MDGHNPFVLRTLLIAAGATAICCICALWALRSPRAKPSPSKKSRKKPCGCTCSCAPACGGDQPLPLPPPTATAAAAAAVPNGEIPSAAAVPNGEMAASVRRPRRVAAMGSSMVEQMVPEVRTHALSYLDYRSLCRLSMANSAMRRAANDDGVWKALYRKDFTVEQDSVTPSNGWKAYYAATRAIVSVNAEFYNIIRDRSLRGMRDFWLNADYVKCLHASGELFTGYTAVIDSWRAALNWGLGGGPGVAFQIREVRARVLSDIAWLTMKAYADIDSEPLHVTNVYELHNGRWYMVHHHSSVMA
ncbi:F-box protein SKIP8 [Ananas comosus]|uniref:F-box protein SKIP8 n=1 Tax=Ananas comosus TaxID=4615 RepID=A0A199VEF7_ANACO|nr:F-box protein SKIP8 [Ananas comosus]